MWQAVYRWLFWTWRVGENGLDPAESWNQVWKIEYPPVNIQRYGQSTMNQKPFPIGTVMDLYSHVSLLQGFSTFHDFRWNWQRSQERLLRTERWPEMPRSLESNGGPNPCTLVNIKLGGTDGCSSSKNWNLWYLWALIQSHIFVVYDPKTLFALWKARGECFFFREKLGGRVVRRKSGSEVQFWNASPHVSSRSNGFICFIIFYP